MAPETIVDNPQGLTRLLVARVEFAAAAAVAARGCFTLAAPGGSVAESFLPPLAAAAAIDWPRVHVFWGDERAVSPDSPESNYGLARSLGFLDRVDPAKVHRMPADAPDLERAAGRYAEELATVLGTPPALDVALLGVGPDGHVCSLFPGHLLLGEERRWVAAVRDSPKPPPKRLTLTLPALRASELVVVAAVGEAKAAAIRDAVVNPASKLPVALATRGVRRALFLLDDAAASRL